METKRTMGVQGAASAAFAKSTAPSPLPNQMGATLHDGGCTFRIWAPLASGAALKSWSGGVAAMPMRLARDSADGYGTGCWSVFVPGVGASTNYRFSITYTPAGGGAPSSYERVDAWGRSIVFPNWTLATQDDSDARSVVVSTDYAWGTPPANVNWHALVIYQLHVGTFAQPTAGSVDSIGNLIGQIPYLQSLGVNAIQLLPFTEFGAALSLGYDSVLPFAIEHDYGEPADFKRLVDALHAVGIAVLIDVVYNHIDVSPGYPQPVYPYSLFQYDGWISEGNGCGVFFYGGDEMNTPWGPRPDYGRPAIQRYLQDNALMWLNEYRVDGLRFDSTKCIRRRQGTCQGQCCGGDIGVQHNYGWELLQGVNQALHTARGDVLTIAEDLDGNGAITSPQAGGGAGFDAQWDTDLLGAIRAAITSYDPAVDVGSIANALQNPFEGNPWQRVVYLESHDQAQASRVCALVQPNDPTGWYARKKSMLGLGVILTSGGIPMFFQGAELLDPRPWGDTVPMDFTRQAQFPNYFRFYGDMVRLRTNVAGRTGGLGGGFTHVVQANASTKVLAYHRWDQGSGIDDVIVVANFSGASFASYTIGVPYLGTWYVRITSDANVYSDAGDFGSVNSYDTTGVGIPWDGMPYSANVGIGPYTILVLSR